MQSRLFGDFGKHHLHSCIVNTNYINCDGCWLAGFRVECIVLYTLHWVKGNITTLYLTSLIAVCVCVHACISVCVCVHACMLAVNFMAHVAMENSHLELQVADL